ncbi:MAG: endopeptidase La [Chloroflexota bacterium]|nr:endopeptidase La [Chloroflexota bacterium]
MTYWEILLSEIETPQTQIDIELSEELEEEGAAIDLPEELPVLPLRGMVVYPQTAIPLTVGQERSIQLVDDVVAGNRMVGLAASKDPSLGIPGPDQVHSIGTLATIHRLFRTPDGTIRLLIQGLQRIRIDEFVETSPYLKARVTRIPEEEVVFADDIEMEALVRSIVDRFTNLAELVPSIPQELVNNALNVEDPLQLVYSIATYVRIELDDAQALLVMDHVGDKIRHLLKLLTKEFEVLSLGRKIQEDAQHEMEKSQRDYYLREQMKAIQRELEEDEDQQEIEKFRQLIEEANMPEEARKEAERELNRLSKLSVAAAEYGVIRTYLDWICSMPWDLRTEDKLDIAHARNILDEDHYGLTDVKARILEFLAVRKLRAEREEDFAERDRYDPVRRDRSGAILLFVGPPGVGKTSLGASIARAMGREFIRMSLGGIRDEAEIRGFRRTYIGAMPGRIIQAIRRAKSRNPLIMLDEIDKLGRDFRGDPGSALLEVLDPEQNAEFRDHYLDVAFDLSDVMFITTANSLDTIPGPLRDRMEVIQLSGYTELEKRAIAAQYLVPRQRRENGLRSEELEFTDAALLKMIRDYTREAGVRHLEREIGKAARKAVTRIAEGAVESVSVDEDDVVELLGKARFGHRSEMRDRTEMPGVATGLAWTPTGGDALFIEATKMKGGKGFQYTGQLGEIMQESAKIAYSFARSRAEELGVDPAFYKEYDIHLHVPAGAVPKDGPSAGVTMATALASLLTGRTAKSNIAMTGELTLSGQVLPVGGVKDKVLAAHRLGADTVILPRKNENDLDDVPEDVRGELNFILVERLDEVLDAALIDQFALTESERPVSN